MTVSGELTFELSSILRTGEPAPVPAALAEASTPRLNNSGQVAFMGDGALLLESGGDVRIVAAPGDPAPGGGAFTQIGEPSLNAQAQVAFWAYSYFPSNHGIFLAGETGIQQLVGSGDPAPGGGQFARFTNVYLNSATQVAFSASISDGRSGMFLFSDGRVVPIAVQGDPAPGGGTFGTLYGFGLNSAGHAVFTATVNPGASGTFLFENGGLVSIARSGDPAPAGESFDSSLAVDGGATYSYFNGASLNDQGQVAFAAATTPSGHGGIFVFSDGKTTREVRELDPAPGGGVFTSMFSPSLNAANQIAFLAATTSGFGLFLSSAGDLTAVVRPPEPAPEGDLFRNVLSPVLNDTGQVSFEGDFADRLHGIYLFSDGAVSRVSGPGDPIPREATFISVGARAINVSGEVLVFGTSFPGGPGLFSGGNALVRAGQAAPGGGAFSELLAAYYWGATIPGEFALLAPDSRGPGLSEGLYVASGETLAFITRTGDPAPGGGTFSGFDSPSLNSRDEIAFAATGSFPQFYGVFLFSGGQLGRLFGTGDPLPGGGSLTSCWYASLNDAGQVAFTASASSVGPWGIYLWSEGSIQAIAQSGDPAPGGGTFDFPGNRIFSSSLNSLGYVAFEANLSTGGRGIFLFANGVINSIARPGDPAPGGEAFTSAFTPSLNDLGEIAFPANTPSGFGVYFYSEGNVVKVAGAGDPAPGGGNFVSANGPWLTATGQLAFTGSLSEGSGVFLATPIR